MSSNQMSKGRVFIPNKTSTYFKSSFLPMLVQKSFSLVPKTVQLGKMSVKPHVKFRSALKCTFFLLTQDGSDSVYMWTQNSVDRPCWWFLQVRMLGVPLLRCASAIKSLCHKNKKREIKYKISTPCSYVLVIFHLYIVNVTLVLSHERLDNFGIFIYIQGSIDSRVEVELV